MPDQEPDNGAVYFGSSRIVPIDLEARAADSEGATCHACGAPAIVIVQMLDPASNIGSAIYLCDRDFDLVTARDKELLAEHMAANYEEPVESCRRTAGLMITGTGRSVRLPTSEGSH